MPNPKRLLYGVVSENLVLLPESIARQYAAERKAIFTLRTYGEARRLAQQGVDVPGLEREDLDEEPGDDDPYDVTQVPEYTNGDWPSPAATIALDYLPDDLDDLGAEEDHFPSFPSLVIDPAQEEEVLRTVRDRGYEVVRDDALISEIE